ncbi:MAG: haloacid dehalogenase [Gammaproteobacteria bacterium]|nr:haloacid dehalogenase [Gammaproteobacteria bacterium]|tara:strand:+ start:1739 stop:2401 length:663 start_codon:yes stop_codon:yes gene_type:complete
MKINPKSVLKNVETLMLDMDGTLLDLAFDNYMWLEHIPRQFSLKKNISYEEAKKLLADKFMLAQGDLCWYSLDHWSDTLGMDILKMHYDASYKIKFLPKAQEFLERVCNQKFRVLLVTNSHRASLELKDANTGICNYFDEIHSSHDYGFAKENQKFWIALQKKIDFDPKNTLFVDDCSYVLRSAKRYGIEMLLKVTQPDSRFSEKNSSEFKGVKQVADIF